MDIIRTKQNKIYGKVSTFISYFSLVFTAAFFILYITHLFKAYMDFSMLPEIWGKRATPFFSGGKLLQLLKFNKIDLLVLFGLFIMLFSNIIAYLAVLPVYISKRNYLYSAITILQLIIFTYAFIG